LQWEGTPHGITAGVAGITRTSLKKGGNSGATKMVEASRA